MDRGSRHGCIKVLAALPEFLEIDGLRLHVHRERAAVARNDDRDGLQDAMETAAAVSRDSLRLDRLDGDDTQRVAGDDDS